MWELFHSDMRQLLGLPHYKLEHRRGFPLQGWENEDCILIDWGVADRRFDFANPLVWQHLTSDWSSLGQLGQVAAQNIIFATGDRKPEHFIWDLDENVAFSIDHEILAGRIYEVVDYLRQELKLLYGNGWHNSPQKLRCFQDSFTAVWNLAELNTDKVCQSYTKNGLDVCVGGFFGRITERERFLDLLMT